MCDNTNIKPGPEYWRDDLDDRPVMVSVKCLAFNQAGCIAETLDSFVRQQTNFRYEVVVHDDASTDGTADIIAEYARKYPSIIKPILETENQYSKHDGTMDRIVSAHIRGKYVAMCEGDDYWCDPQKLQKQVDYMEAHPDCVLTHTNYYVQEGDRRTENVHTVSPYGDDMLSKLIQEGNPVSTLTVVYRRDALDRIPRLFKGKKFGMGDYPRWIEMAKEGTFHYFPDYTSVYRVMLESASHSGSAKKRVAFIRNTERIQRFYAEQYGIPLREDRIAEAYRLHQRTAFVLQQYDLERLLWQDIKRVGQPIPMSARLYHAFTFKGVAGRLMRRMLGMLRRGS